MILPNISNYSESIHFTIYIGTTDITIYIILYVCHHMYVITQSTCLSSHVCHYTVYMYVITQSTCLSSHVCHYTVYMYVITQSTCMSSHGLSCGYCSLVSRWVIYDMRIKVGYLSPSVCNITHNDPLILMR